MKRNIIYFVDEDPPARRANVEALKALLGTVEIDVHGVEPLKSFADYDPLLAAPTTAAFILDQRMKQGGLVSYNGTELAEHLRGIDAKMPLYILTGYADQADDFRGTEFRVEAIIPKDAIEDPASEQAQMIKARLLRHLNVFNDVRNTREQRFHDLLVKSLREPLTTDEQQEMDKIEGETTAPILAAERNRERELGEQVDKLRKLIEGGKLPL
jgi:FixJ family two-component response regulator